MFSGIDQEREALEEFRKASDLEPGNTLYLEHLAVSLALNGDMNGAVEKLQKAVVLAPTSPEAQFNLGYALETKGDFAAAVAPLEKAVELSKGKNAQFLVELAKAYDKTGRAAEAVRAAQQALDLAVQQHNAELEGRLRGFSMSTEVTRRPPSPSSERLSRPTSLDRQRHRRRSAAFAIVAAGGPRLRSKETCHAWLLYSGYREILLWASSLHEGHSGFCWLPV